MPYDLTKQMIHLGLGAKAIPQPPFDGMPWYDAYGARVASDGAEGRLVAIHTFDKPWGSWEMHPLGEEVVLCLSGSITLVLELDGVERRVTLNAGEYEINAPGTWHTADVEVPTSCLFITAGKGTQHRPR